MYKDAPNPKSSKPLQKKKKSGLDAIMQQYDNLAAKDTAKFKQVLEDTKFDGTILA